MLDSKGEAEADFLEPATDQIPPSTINVMLMPMSDAGRVAGFFSVILLLPVAVVLVLVAGILTVFKKRAAYGFAIAAGIIILLTPLFFYLGVTTISQLIIFDNDISYSLGFYLPFLMGPAAIAAGVLLYRSIPIKKKEVAVIMVDDEDNEYVPKKRSGKNKGLKKRGD